MARTARAAVIEKQSAAVALRRQGASYEEIADQLGYANRGSAWRALDAGLRAERDLRAGDYLETAVARYEGIVRTFWPRATIDQDTKAALVVLRALERLDRVLRLGNDAQAGHSGERLVISADPKAYVEQLQQVVEGRQRHGRG